MTVQTSKQVAASVAAAAAKLATKKSPAYQAGKVAAKAEAKSVVVMCHGKNSIICHGKNPAALKADGTLLSNVCLEDLKAYRLAAKLCASARKPAATTVAAKAPKASATKGTLALTPRHQPALAMQPAMQLVGIAVPTATVNDVTAAE